MYGWIWRRLPFDFWGKVGACLGMVVAVAALLWFVVFPAVEPHLPFNDGQLEDTGGTGQTEGTTE